MPTTRDEFIELVIKQDWHSLKRADLSNLNAQELDFSSEGLQFDVFGNLNLSESNFRLSKLTLADFSGSTLVDSIFVSADLVGANLSQTDARRADFSYANLRMANLRDMQAELANFTEADFTEADFVGAFLIKAQFVGAVFSEKTVLPDFTQWSQNTDLSRFTNPHHPEFFIDPSWTKRYVEEVKRKYEE